MFTHKDENLSCDKPEQKVIERVKKTGFTICTIKQVFCLPPFPEKKWLVMPLFSCK